MKNLPNNPQTPSAIPVGDTGGALVSKFPAALPTVAADALICLDRAELNSFWPEGIRGFKPREEWQALCQWLDLSPMKPALN